MAKWFIILHTQTNGFHSDVNIMLILKGTQGKSRVIDNIRHSLRNYANSICFEYTNGRPVMYDSTYITYDECTPMEFVECVHDFIKTDYYGYTYIFIYTNKTEDELYDAIQWLEKQPYHINIILACR